MTALPVRFGELKDVAALTSLINRAFVAEQPYITGERINAQGVIELLAKGKFLLSEDEGALVACLFIEARGERAHLGLVSVEPQRQGKGLGSHLMAAAESHCRSAGFREMELRFIYDRAELQRFYESLGYAATGVTEFPDPSRMKVPFHFVQMMKRLD
jgi:GNAT superfamily N-acetyltransferase